MVLSASWNILLVPLSSSDKVSFILIMCVCVCVLFFLLTASVHAIVISFRKLRILFVGKRRAGHMVDFAVEAINNEVIQLNWLKNKKKKKKGLAINFS